MPFLPPNQQRQSTEGILCFRNWNQKQHYCDSCTVTHARDEQPTAFGFLEWISCLHFTTAQQDWKQEAVSSTLMPENGSFCSCSRYLSRLMNVSKKIGVSEHDFKSWRWMRPSSFGWTMSSICTPRQFMTLSQCCSQSTTQQQKQPFNDPFKVQAKLQILVNKN